jgi:hypothetical protein
MMLYTEIFFPHCWPLSAKLHSVTFKKKGIFTVTDMGISNLTAFKRVQHATLWSVTILMPLYNLAMAKAWG